MGAVKPIGHGIARVHRVQDTVIKTHCWNAGMAFHFDLSTLQYSADDTLRRQMANIEDILKTRIQNNNAETFVVLVPTNSARLKRQRELLAYHPNKAVANLHVETLEKFVQKLYAQLRPTDRPNRISPGMQTLWLRKLVDRLRPETFQPMEGVKVPDSTLSLIVSTINSLSEHSATNVEWAQFSTPNTPILETLAEIYASYQKEMGNEWVDDAGMHHFLASQFQQRLMRKAFPHVTLVVVEDFDVLSKASIALLKQIAEMPNMQLCIRSDYSNENRALFGHIQKLFDELSSPNIAIREFPSQHSERNRHFADNLFRTGEPDAERWNAEEQIKLVKPVDRRDEVELIAQLIRQRVATGACELSDICVTYHDLRSYLQQISEIFPEYGIPYSVLEGIPLVHSPLVKAIFSQLKGGTSPTASPYFSTTSLANEISREEQIAPEAFKTYFAEFLREREVLCNILNLSGSSHSQARIATDSEIHAYNELNARVSELCDSLDEQRYRYKDYIEWLRLIVMHTTYQIPETDGGVRILRLSQLRSLEFDTVILGDLIDGKFPESFRPDALLPQAYARNETDLLCQNRFLFYTVLKTFRKRLYLMSPQRENETLLIPSPFLAQLEQVAKIDTEVVENMGEFSQSSFLRKYGQYLWDCEEPGTLYSREAADTLGDNVFQNLQECCSLIDHVVTVEKSREKTHNRLAYEGILTAGPLSVESSAQLRRRCDETYSITKLEKYAACPFQFFADDVLTFRKKEEVLEEEGLSALERGDLVHQILSEFHRNRPSSARLAQCSPSEIQEAKAQLREIIDKQLSNSESDNLLREIDETLLRTALRKWFEAEQKSDVNMHPSYFEVDIDYQNSLQIDDVRLKAKIDRIDVGDTVFNVIDYKTGNTIPKMPDILEGRALQLPLYIKMAQQQQNGKSIPAAGLYYKIRFDGCKVELGIGKETYKKVAYKTYNGETWKSITSKQMVSEEEFDNVIERVSGYVRQYVDAIGRGKFPLITQVKEFVDSVEDGDAPLTPRNLTAPCSYCSYKKMCRVGAMSKSSSVETS